MVWVIIQQWLGSQGSELEGGGTTRKWGLMEGPSEIVPSKGIPFEVITFWDEEVWDHLKPVPV
jgi:hypothetical protein